MKLTLVVFIATFHLGAALEGSNSSVLLFLPSFLISKDQLSDVETLQSHMDDFKEVFSARNDPQRLELLKQWLVQTRAKSIIPTYDHVKNHLVSNIKEIKVAASANFPGTDPRDPSVIADEPVVQVESTVIKEVTVTQSITEIVTQVFTNVETSTAVIQVIEAAHESEEPRSTVDAGSEDAGYTAKDILSKKNPPHQLSINPQFAHHSNDAVDFGVYNKPKVSPLRDGQLADESLRGRLRESLRESLSESLSDSLGESLSERLRERLGGRLGDSLGESLSDSLGENLSDSLGESLRERLSQEVEKYAEGGELDVEQVIEDSEDNVEEEDLEKEDLDEDAFAGQKSSGTPQNAHLSDDTEEKLNRYVLPVASLEAEIAASLNATSAQRTQSETALQQAHSNGSKTYATHSKWGSLPSTSSYKLRKKKWTRKNHTRPEFHHLFSINSESSQVDLNYASLFAAIILAGFTVLLL